MNELLFEKLLEGKQTKQELSILYNTSERHIREAISQISMEYPVISHSKAKGYRISNVDQLLKENNSNNINSEIEEIQHTLNEINSRIKILKKKQKPLIAALKVLEKGGNE